MANVLEAFGTNGQTFTCTLASLTDGSARQSTIVDNTSNLYSDVLVVIKVKTGASGASAAGNVQIFGIGTVDNGTTQTDLAGASDAAITVNSAPPIGSIPATANATTYVGGPFSLAKAFGGTVPAKFGIIIKNKTGTTLDSTEGNHAKLWQGVYATVA